MWIFINNRATTTKNTLADLFPITVTLPYAYSYSTSNLCHIFHYPYKACCHQVSFHSTADKYQKAPVIWKFSSKSYSMCNLSSRPKNWTLKQSERERERERERWKIQFKADCQPYKKGHVRHKYLQSLQVIYSSFMKCLGYIN